ncbi:MAG: PASTA domain-containing protein [Turicibacter sp.]|nr:PASTA domain-containing protein [Turicibacter sp.]
MNSNFLSQFEGKGLADKNVPKALVPASTPSKITAPSHVVVQDQGYHKRKIVKMSIMGASAIIVSILVFFGIRLMNAVEIMDFTGQPVTVANQWALQNGMSIQQNERFNLEFDPGVVFGQSIEAGASLQRGGVVVLEVSRGADPNEVIALPDFLGMTTGQIQTWRNQYRIGNAVQVRQEYHDTIEAGQFIDMEHLPAVDLENFTRQSSLTVVMSNGPRMLAMPNYVGRDVEDVKAWQEEHNLNVTIETRTDNEADAGEVLEQSIEARQRFATTEEIIITVAAGEFILVPDFSQMSQDDALEFEGLTVTRRNRFSATVAFGRLIEQSLPAGTQIDESMNRLTVTYSLGRPFMESLVGQSEGMLSAHFFETFTSRGASLTFAVRHVDSYEPRGQIVAQSRTGEFVGMNDHITFDVSRGNLNPPAPYVPTPVPDMPYEPSEGADYGYGYE